MRTQNDRDWAGVAGTGFGGLGAALRLAEEGRAVRVFEAMKIPGGCASTFERHQFRFEAGATLFAGLEPGGPIHELAQRQKLEVEFDCPDEVVELRTREFNLRVPNDRDLFVDRLVALTPEAETQLRSFFARQRSVADVIWRSFRADLLPPFGRAAIWRHFVSLPRYVSLLPYLGRSLLDVLQSYGLADNIPLRRFCDEVCQITVQCSAAEAEAPFALATLDYFFRGAGHIKGGIGRLAESICQRLEDLGAELHYGTAITKFSRQKDRGWRLSSKRGEFDADIVLANILPSDAATRITDESLRSRCLELGRPLEEGWSACMLYLVLDNFSPACRHLALIDTDGEDLSEGRHVFCSLSDPQDSHRTATVSTHVSLKVLSKLSDEERIVYLTDVQERMRLSLKRLAPEIHAGIQREFTASPRTFFRFTGRPAGCVGGIPKRRGLSHYSALFRQPLARDFDLVGDSVFPGQSTLAAFLGGQAAASALLRRSN